MSLIKSYFDEASGNYSEYSAGGLWRLVRNNEARVIINMLPEITDLTTALDLGCGVGFYSDVLRQQGVRNITCVDFSEKMLGQIKNQKYRKILANIEQFQSNQKYDIILCAGALEFTKNSQKVFENISLMLNKSGCFILLYPTQNYFGYLYQYYHKRHRISVNLYREKDINIFAKNVGLKFFNSAYAFPFSKVIKYT